MKLSIVVPCYNESKNIPLILKRFSECIDTRQIELILVNNGSTDDSQQVIDSLLPSYQFAKSTLVPVNQGYGYGIVSGLRTAQGEFIGWTHADMQTDPMDVIKAYDAIMEMSDRHVYVKGSRKKRPFIDRFFTVGMSAFETLYLKTPLWDINAQPNLFPRSYFESLEMFPDDFSLDLYMYYMAKRKGLKIVRFPVLFTERIHGESKWNDQTFKAKWKFIKRTLTFSVELKKRLRKG